jgi:hypothetical protein
MLLLCLLMAMVRVLLLLLLGSNGGSRFLLFCLRWTQVGVLDHGVHIHAVILSIGQTLPNEYFCGVRHCRLVGKVNLRCLQNDVLLQNGGLRLVVAKWLKLRKLNFKLL